MKLIIDGYNLLHASGVFAPKGGPATLERSRASLLSWIVNSLTPEEATSAVVVFDAQNAPAGLPRSFVRDGLTVLFADPKRDADAVIEDLIQQSSAPRALTVVSSDHRVQRAANRRKARAIDSHDWVAEMNARRRAKHNASAPAGAPYRDHVVSEGEVFAWLALFNLLDDAKGSEEPASQDSTLDDDPIFPPGYAESEFFGDDAEWNDLDIL